MQSRWRKDAFGCRDPRVILQLMSHWQTSLERSRARRARADRARTRPGAPWATPRHARRCCWTPAAVQRRHATSPKTSRGICRWGARARAVAPRSCASCPPARAPSASRWARSRRFTVGPTAAMASRRRNARAPRPTPNRRPPPNTASCSAAAREGRQVQLLQQALGNVKVDGVFGPETEAAVRELPGKPRAERRRHSRLADRGRAARRIGQGARSQLHLSGRSKAPPATAQQPLSPPPPPRQAPPPASCPRKARPRATKRVAQPRCSGCRPRSS